MPGTMDAMRSIAADQNRVGLAFEADGGIRRKAPGVADGGRYVIMRCRERAPVRVRGPVTGRIYEFSPRQPTLSIDARDAETLLRTQRFVRI